jgi:16S rRNA (guanine966-N2)-methyltransferase
MNSHRNRSDSARPPSRTARPAKSAKLRIIGGEMRGRSIQYHGAEFTRPMKDSVRENLFNILGPAVRGSICFDLFAGTGALTLESLSRGASSAVLIEQNRHAARYIKQNAAALGVSERMRLITADALRIAVRLLGPPPNDTPWIVFLCPPYALWQQSLPQLSAIIQAGLDHAPPGSVLVAETEKRFDASQLPGEPWDLRHYGSTQLALIKPASCCGMSL